MMPEDMIKIMLQSMLPLKFDIKIKITDSDKEEIEHTLKGDIFQSKLKGETKNRVFIALELPEGEET